MGTKEWDGEERRKGPNSLTDEDVDALLDRLEERLYVKLGKAILRKVLLLLAGALGVAFIAWIAGNGHVTVKLL